MRKFLVGGAVRDKAMGREPNDLDYVVVGATPDEMIKNGFKQVGKSFPVFLDKEGNEYALARTERKCGDKHTDFLFDFNPNITLEDDLVRRDFTCNSLAEDENGEIIDLFGGLEDIKNRVLRHIRKETFKEDPLRVVRLARFSAQLDFRIDITTLMTCREMVEEGMLEFLPAERIWGEFYKALKTNHFANFIKTLDYIGALEHIIPEVFNLKTVPENIEHHPCGNTYAHTILCLEYADKKMLQPHEKLGLLCHDLGKQLTPKEILPKHPNHALEGVPLVKEFCNRLKVPTQLKVFAMQSAEFHMKLKDIPKMRIGSVYDIVCHLTDNFKNIENLMQLFNVSEADMYGRAKEPSEDHKIRMIKGRKRCVDVFNALQNVSAKDFPEMEKYKNEEFGEILRVKKLQYLMDNYPELNLTF